MNTNLSKRWNRIGRIFHLVSYAKLGFYLAGTYYMVRGFITYNPETFPENVSFTLLLYGFAMTLEGLRDNSVLPETTRLRFLKKPGHWATYLLVSIFAFAWVPLFGLFMLFYVKDEQQGVAIIAFGIGGLSLMRQEYERFHAIVTNSPSREAEAEVEGQKSQG